MGGSDACHALPGTARGEITPAYPGHDHPELLIGGVVGGPLSVTGGAASTSLQTTAIPASGGTVASKRRAGVVEQAPSGLATPSGDESCEAAPAAPRRRRSESLPLGVTLPNSSGQAPRRDAQGNYSIVSPAAAHRDEGDVPWNGPPRAPGNYPGGARHDGSTQASIYAPGAPEYFGLAPEAIFGARVDIGTQSGGLRGDVLPCLSVHPSQELTNVQVMCSSAAPSDTPGHSLGGLPTPSQPDRPDSSSPIVSPGGQVPSHRAGS